MAKTTKSGKRKATTKKTGGKRNETPKLDCPFVAILTRPHPTESSGKLATRFAEFAVVKEAWTGEVRKAYAGGAKKNDLPIFPTGKFVNPNTGLMSRSAHNKANAEYDEAVDAGRKTPVCLPRYSPVVVDLIHEMNAVSLRKGSLKNHPNPPKDWNEKEYGSWYHDWTDEDGEKIQEASGWFFDPKAPRRCHAEKAEILVEEPETNILTFGNLRIVCGTGTHDGSAVFMVNQTSHGNYRAGDLTRKRMSLAGNKDVRNLVFKIEDRANNGGGFTVKGNWRDVREMVYMPGQVFTIGFLYDSNGKQIDAKTIRGLDGDTKGLRFKGLDEPIVGKAVLWSKLWAEIQVADKKAIKAMRDRGGRSDEFEAGSTQTKSITNICVNGKRVDPSEAFPFGLRGSQIHMPAYIVATGEGKIEEGHFSMGVILGERSNDQYNVTVHEPKGDSEAETEEVETPAPKRQTRATKHKKAAAAPKKKAAAKATDAAPPVEADTAEEVEADVETADVAE